MKCNKKKKNVKKKKKIDRNEMVLNVERGKTVENV
jgi:hypothetical protein